MTGSLILIGSLRCLKEESQWTWYLFSVYFKIGFLNFSNRCCWYIWAIPMCTYSICPFNRCVFFTIKQVSHKLLNLFMLQCNEHVEMNKLLCSLECTWMTIIDTQFYIIDSLSLVCCLTCAVNIWLKRHLLLVGFWLTFTSIIHIWTASVIVQMVSFRCISRPHFQNEYF